LQGSDSCGGNINLRRSVAVQLPLLLAVLTILNPAERGAAAVSQTPVRSSASQEQTQRRAPGTTVITGRVREMFAARLFSLRPDDDGREVLVLAPRPLSPAMIGARLRVAGSLRRVGEAQLRSTPGWGGIDPATRERLVRGPVFVATAVLGAIENESPAPDAPLPGRRDAPPGPPDIERTVDTGPPGPLAMRASMIVAYPDGFAGRAIRVLDGRVVGVLEPRAFLIEPATEYLKPMGERDRIVVLIENGELAVDPALLVGSTVAVEGTARTLLGARISREIPWPSRLSDEVIDRLEVRTAILATSVQTPDGIELTHRR
jgi:hypothetical protein